MNGFVSFMIGQQQMWAVPLFTEIIMFLPFSSPTLVLLPYLVLSNVMFFPTQGLDATHLLR